VEEVAPHAAAGKPIEWRMSDQVVVPAHLTLLPLPPKCPELNPVETIGEFMRDNWFSNRIFTSYKNILDPCCPAWNKLVAQPWTIMSSRLQDRAYGF
jgi:hypothetical protein